MSSVERLLLTDKFHHHFARQPQQLQNKRKDQSISLPPINVRGLTFQSTPYSTTDNEKESALPPVVETVSTTQRYGSNWQHQRNYLNSTYDKRWNDNEMYDVGIAGRALRRGHPSKIPQVSSIDSRSHRNVKFIPRISRLPLLITCNAAPLHPTKHGLTAQQRPVPPSMFVNMFSRCTIRSLPSVHYVSHKFSHYDITERAGAPTGTVKNQMDLHNTSLNLLHQSSKNEGYTSATEDSQHKKLYPICSMQMKLSYSSKGGFKLLQYKHMDGRYSSLCPSTDNVHLPPLTRPLKPAIDPLHHSEWKQTTLRRLTTTPLFCIDKSEHTSNVLECKYQTNTPSASSRLSQLKQSHNFTTGPLQQLEQRQLPPKLPLNHMFCIDKSECTSSVVECKYHSDIQYATNQHQFHRKHATYTHFPVAVHSEEQQRIEHNTDGSAVSGDLQVSCPNMDKMTADVNSVSAICMQVREEEEWVSSDCELSDIIDGIPKEVSGTCVSGDSIEGDQVYGIQHPGITSHVSIIQSETDMYCISSPMMTGHSEKLIYEPHDHMSPEEISSPVSEHPPAVLHCSSPQETTAMLDKPDTTNTNKQDCYGVSPGESDMRTKWKKALSQERGILQSIQTDLDNLSQSQAANHTNRIKQSKANVKSSKKGSLAPKPSMDEKISDADADNAAAADDDNDISPSLVKTRVHMQHEYSDSDQSFAIHNEDRHAIAPSPTDDIQVSPVIVSPTSFESLSTDAINEESRNSVSLSSGNHYSSGFCGDHSPHSSLSSLSEGEFAELPASNDVFVEDPGSIHPEHGYGHEDIKQSRRKKKKFVRRSTYRSPNVSTVKPHTSSKTKAPPKHVLSVSEPSPTHEPLIKKVLLSEIDEVMDRIKQIKVGCR